MLGWFRNRKNLGLQYTKDKPPNIRAATSAIMTSTFHAGLTVAIGFAASTCVLRFSRLIDDFRKFKCPRVMCESQKQVDLLQCMKGILYYLIFDNMQLSYLLIQTAYAIYDFRFWPTGKLRVGCLATYSFICLTEGTEFRVVQTLRCALFALFIWLNIWMDRRLRR
ncbi:hypothetical protein SASPL_156696 [Salvia splendens]|uniref:Uncharacterized protein n=1 Tax=Salvia splendens TaxID=180675 RepID=A0A8X8YWD2_SALSN|nr:hypothetical protein SASPL_156696 [Salvia splendens]